MRKADSNKSSKSIITADTINKVNKSPPPIKLKKEKTEEDRALHLMTHYLDDRLELVRQIFGTLKPKTIKNLAPDFLKDKQLMEIETLCLEELLCFSTKRLRAIIYATKCPSDTDSSGESDVEHQEEHVSLEEISSDSEIENGVSNKARKRTGAKKVSKTNTQQSTEKDKNGTDGQISVLELLELQARARAIRSQLALKPVTKIEVDSDVEISDASNHSKLSKTPTSHKAEKNYRSSQTPEVFSSQQDLMNGTVSNHSSTSTEKGSTGNGPPTEGVKLKRNYRSANLNEKEPEAKIRQNGLIEEKIPALKKERASRSLSPDVIPVIFQPETLLIRDSDAETDEPKTQTTIDAIPNVEECDNINNDSEEEEGEIREDTALVQLSDNNSRLMNEAKNDTQLTMDITNGEQSVELNPLKVSDVSAPTNSSSDSQNNAKKNLKKVDSPVDKKKTKKKEVTRTSSLTDNSSETAMLSDHNDDVISLEGGDLENEMINHLNEDTSEETLEVAAEEITNKEIIMLGSSDEDASKGTESWRSRYLKSSKVSKVLAASRLGKRVRDKIRSKKRTNSESVQKIANSPENQVKRVFTSKHEDGSIEQYNELLELNPCKP